MSLTSKRCKLCQLYYYFTGIKTQTSNCPFCMKMWLVRRNLTPEQKSFCSGSEIGLKRGEECQGQ